MKAVRFLYGLDQSRCCQSKTLLVRSREGGMVSQNCLKCGKSGYITLERLPNVDCDFCGAQLVAVKGERSNYYYKCEGCNRAWKLADNLPPWSDLFSYCGLAAFGDGDAFASPR